MLERTYTTTRIGGRGTVIERTPGGDMRRVGIVEAHPTPEHGEQSCIVRSMTGARLGIAISPAAALAWLADRARGDRFAAADMHLTDDSALEALYLLAVEHDIEPKGLPMTDLLPTLYGLEPDEGWTWMDYLDDGITPDLERALTIMRAKA